MIPDHVGSVANVVAAVPNVADRFVDDAPKPGDHFGGGVTVAHGGSIVAPAVADPVRAVLAQAPAIPLAADTVADLRLEQGALAAAALLLAAALGGVGRAGAALPAAGKRGNVRRKDRRAFPGRPAKPISDRQALSPQSAESICG